MIKVLEEKGGCVKYLDENGEETWLKKEVFYKRYKGQIEETKPVELPKNDTINTSQEPIVRQGLETNKIYNLDCLEGMKMLPNKSIDMVLCDLPYGTSACSWDSVIDLKKLWEQYKRIIKDTGAIVLFSQQPFTSILINSNLVMYKYNWVWEKDSGTNFLNSHYQPLKVTEDICVFGKLGCSYNKQGNMRYFPQFGQGKPYVCVSGKQKSDSAVVRGGTGGREDVNGFETISDGKRYPKNLIKFNRDKEKLHPTQKPLALCEYFIKTYTNEGDLVLDNCIGSGTTALACKELNRNFIGFELNKDFVDIANKRLEGIKREGEDGSQNS